MEIESQVLRKISEETNSYDYGSLVLVLKKAFVFAFQYILNTTKEPKFSIDEKRQIIKIDFLVFSNDEQKSKELEKKSQKIESLAKSLFIDAVKTKNVSEDYKRKGLVSGQLVSGIIRAGKNPKNQKFIIVELDGGIEAILPKENQIDSENYKSNTRMRFIVTKTIKVPKELDVQKEINESDLQEKNLKNGQEQGCGKTKNPPKHLPFFEKNIVLSRRHPSLIARLFEREVPELEDKSIEIVFIAREPGSRAKVSYKANNKSINALGSLIGKNNFRLDAVINELNGEKIDIIEYSENEEEYVKNALSPVIVNKIEKKEDGFYLAHVPAFHYSLAIGGNGQNVRLAALLTKTRIEVTKDE